jgi:replicative DNA helicase
VPTAAHLEQYAQIVADKSVRRRLISASQDIASIGFDENKSLQELIEEAETRLFEVSQRHVRQDVTSLESILGESFDRLDDLHRNKGGIRGIPTGLRDLDKLLAGLQRSDLIVIAARPSMGKTAIMLNMALDIATKAKQGSVLYFSLK